MKKLIEEKTKFNENSGEIEISKKFISKKQDEEFMFIFTKFIGNITGLSGKTYELLFALMRYANYENEVYPHKEVKEKICSMFKMSVNTLEKSLGVLVKREILIKKQRGVFVFNAKYFGKGSLQNIKSLRIIQQTDINFENKTIKSTLASKADYYSSQEIENRSIQELEHQLQIAKQTIAETKRKTELENETSLFENNKKNI